MPFVETSRACRNDDYTAVLEELSDPVLRNERSAVSGLVFHFKKFNGCKKPRGTRAF
jgi:hypothetical protein